MNLCCRGSVDVSVEIDRWLSTVCGHSFTRSISVIRRSINIVFKGGTHITAPRQHCRNRMSARAQCGYVCPSQLLPGEHLVLFTYATEQVSFHDTIYQISIRHNSKKPIQSHSAHIVLIHLTRLFVHPIHQMKRCKRWMCYRSGLEVLAILQTG
jgi:hypothetical protein